MKRLFFLFLLTSIASSCEEKPESILVVQGDITESVYASGSVRSKNQYQVYATINGLVQQVLVEEGDVVKKGSPLYIIQSEASKLTAENARLAAEFARNNTSGDRLAELKSAIDLAYTRLVNDSLLLARQQGLWLQQIGSKVELEQRMLAYNSSSNSYQAAILRYRDAKKQLEFSSAQSQKQWAISQVLQSDYIIRAQQDGRVYRLFKEVGELVSPQTAVAILGHATAFETELQVDEHDIAKVKPGQRVLLTLDSYKGQVFEASLTRIAPLMNERSRTFTVTAEFTNKPPVLYPNFSVEANILIADKNNVLIVPRNYLLGDSVVILENKEKVSVNIGLKDYQKVEILSGLSAGQRILKPD